MLSFLKSKGEKLFIACNDGNIKAVASVLKTATAADVNYIDKEGNSPLLLAAYRGHLETVVALLTHPGVDVKLKDKRGDTALLCAYNKGYSHVMGALLKHPDVDVNATNKNGDTAFESACKLGHLEVLKLLLAHPHVDVNVQIQIGRAAIIYASENGHTEVVKLLLTHPKLDVNTQDMDGWTALNFASRGGYAEIVKSILAHPKLDANKQDEDGWTALMHASENGHPEVVMLLLTHPGIDINLQDKYARTALDLAKTKDIENLIRNHRASSVSVPSSTKIAPHTASISDNNTYKVDTTPSTQLLGTMSGSRPFDFMLAEQLVVAARTGDIVTVDKLLQSATAAEVNHKKDGDTALTAASCKGRSDVVKLLLAYPGVDVNVQNKDGWTALMDAAESGELELVKLLLAHPDVDVNMTNTYGTTAIMCAAEYSHLEVVKLLLAHSGIAVDVQDMFGKTAQDLARKEEIAILIRRHRTSSAPALSASGIASHTASIADSNTGKEVITPSIHLLSTKSGNRTFNVELAEQLVNAAKAGDSVTLTKLLPSASAAEVNCEKDRETALMRAAQSGHLEPVKLLLAHPEVDANFQNKDGRTALMNASASGHLDVVKLLSAHPGADVHVSDKYGWTALMHASLGGHLEIVKLLLAHSCVDVNMLSKDGRTALDLAKTEDIKALLLLLRTAPSENATLEQDKHSESTYYPDVPSTSTRQLILQQPELQQKKEQQKEEQQKEVQVKKEQQQKEVQQRKNELTEQDRAALESFLISYTPAVGVALQRAEHLNEMAGQLAAHDRALHVLVNKQKECPSLFWFYPKKRELRNWLSNPLKCLLQDSLMMVVVCPVTLCVVKCGPDGVGWEIRSPKAWVKKWGPAILASIYVMQAAVLAGRIVGIPLPTLPSVGEIANVLGLQAGGGVLKDGMSAVTDQVSAENLMNSLQGFASVTEQCLEEHKTEMGGLIHKMQLQQQQQRRQNQSSKSTAPPPHEEITLGTDMPTSMIAASYHLLFCGDLFMRSEAKIYFF